MNKHSVSTKRIKTSRAKCSTCHKEFDYPLLPDMSYGEFIAKGERGTVFAYFLALDNLGWDTVQTLFQKVALKGLNSPDCFQWIIGQCLNPIDGQILTIVDGPICPVCHSRHIEYDYDQPDAVVDLPIASFSNFLSLDKATQEDMVKKLYDEWYSRGLRQ